MAGKVRKQDAFIARVTITQPLDLSKPNSLQVAIERLQGLKIEGATITIVATHLGKIDAVPTAESELEPPAFLRRAQ